MPIQYDSKIHHKILIITNHTRTNLKWLHKTVFAIFHKEIISYEFHDTCKTSIMYQETKEILLSFRFLLKSLKIEIIINQFLYSLIYFSTYQNLQIKQTRMMLLVEKYYKFV